MSRNELLAVVGGLIVGFLAIYGIITSLYGSKSGGQLPNRQPPYEPQTNGAPNDQSPKGDE
jgi:hypothetical protein